MAKTPTKNTGCFWMLSLGFLTLFGFIIIAALFDLNNTLSLIIGFIIALIATVKILGKPNVKSTTTGLITIIVVVYGFKAMISFLTGSLNQEYTEDGTSIEIEEGVIKTTLFEENDTIPAYTSNRVWRDNYGNNYAGSLTVRDNDYQRLKTSLSTWKATDVSRNFWGQLYEQLDKTDGSSLDLIINTFDKIGREKKLNQMEFAEMVVSSIQDIPYSLIFQKKCLPAENYEPNIRRVLEECPQCCMGNVPYGIQNPVSFMQNLKGDCDTRTVIIYSILKQFDYDVAILNSHHYRHSILGLNLPTKGEFKNYNGKKYYVWETTSKYYPAGDLPANFKDMIHWNVVLTSK